MIEEINEKTRCLRDWENYNTLKIFEREFKNTYPNTLINGKKYE